MRASDDPLAGYGRRNLMRNRARALRDIVARRLMSSDEPYAGEVARYDAIMRSQSTSLIERRVRHNGAEGWSDRRGLNTACRLPMEAKERRVALLAGGFIAGARS